MTDAWFRPLAVCLLVFGTLGQPRAEQVLQVPQNGDLQGALDRARPGDTILLRAGATYVGNFVLSAKPGNGFITVRTDDASGQPARGVRVSPVHVPTLAKIQSPNRQPALRTAPGAHHWRLELLEFLPTSDGTGEIIALGDGSSVQRELPQVPEQLVIDRCYIHGHSTAGQKRGIALNSGHTTITNSYIAEIKARGQDSQAIGGWNGPGPYVIENNYLEASGENFMLGGADPAINGLITSDVTFRGNHLSKPIAWRDEGWTVKNLFELKNARRVLVEGNLMEYSWRQAQVGYAILLTPRNQNGGAPWVTVEDVTIRRNIVRHTGGGLQIIGPDTNHPSGPTQRIRVEDNLFYDIDARKWGGTGAFLLLGEGPKDVIVEHNTVSQSGNIAIVFGGTRHAPITVEGFTFRGNLIRHNQYGIHGNDRAPGRDSVTTFFPGAQVVANGIAGGNAGNFPSGNHFLPEAEFDAQFQNPAAGDFRLRTGSRFRGAGPDGRDLGADIRSLAVMLGLRPRGSAQ